MADKGRALKIADRIKVLIGANLTQVAKDPDLGMVTVTDVRVTGDLQHASVFYTVLGDDAARERTAEVLERYKGRLRSFVGKQLGIRLTPTLEFIADALPDSAAHLEDLLAQAKARDEQVAGLAAGATYAGDADPYKHDEDDDDTDEDNTDEDDTDVDAAADDGDRARS